VEGNKKHTVHLLDQIARVENKQISNAIIMNFDDRMQVYLNDSFKEVQNAILPRANEILSKLDIVDMVYTSTPIVNQMDSLKYVVPFMKITVNTLISFLLLLNFTLIYHIFGLSLQDKLFHFGIMRTLGFKRNRLYLVLFAQGLFLSLVTFIISFPLMFLLFATFNSMDLQIQLFEEAIYPSFQNILLTCFLNFLVPQVSLLIPGYRFFSKKIMESIDNRAELFASLKISNKKSSNIFSKPFLYSNLKVTS
jgi:ABC-type antimicrobial peptide transport system permease subunit